MSVEQEPIPLRSRTVRITLAVLTVLLFCALLALGTWQVQRLHWKEALLARIETQLAAPPADLVEIELAIASGEAVEYRPLTVTGRFDHGREQFFFATYEGQPGFHVYTPLQLDDGRWLFVNRGFTPFDRKDPATRTEGQTAGEVTVTGLAREPLLEKPSWILPDNDPAKNIFYWKDIAAMAANAGIADPVPLFLDAGDTPNPGGLPVGGVTIIDLPNNHLQYVVTWYGLAAALAGVAIVFGLRSREGEGYR